VKVISGKIRVDDNVEAAVDVTNRRKISNNHTATHLLHASLRQILGDHVKQAGSLVESSRLRFDFTHFAALSSPELEQIELLVNEKIREGIEVKTKVTTLEKGLKEGAVAIFEEKYGERVRMVTIGDFSKELCGGVHVHSTAQIGLFKIIAESSVAAGMRRIEALTGEEALKRTQETEEVLIQIQAALNSPRTGLLAQIEKLKESVKSKEREARVMRQKIAKQELKLKEEEVRQIKGISVLVQKVKGLNNTELRELADSLKQKIGSGVVILGSASGKKVFLVTAVTKDLIARIKADELVKEIASRLDGGGGGRPDFAQAGGTKPEQLEKVLEESYTIIEKMIS
jgi:alanyl-tRNA synthetase